MRKQDDKHRIIGSVEQDSSGNETKDITKEIDYKRNFRHKTMISESLNKNIFYF